jgi:putative toxin-antitoxin system antitoxin component (TIGR02293 family)
MPGTGHSEQPGGTFGRAHARAHSGAHSGAFIGAQPHGSAGISTDLDLFGDCLQHDRLQSHQYVALLGMRSFDIGTLLHEVQTGLPYTAFERLQSNMGLSSGALAHAAGISARTLSRRKEAGRLQPDESDRLVRLSRIFGLALELLEGDVEAARRWLGQSHAVLGGATPLEMARTELGAREVEALIGRLEHGVFT